jgi:hypothetical protein
MVWQFDLADFGRKRRPVLLRDFDFSCASPLGHTIRKRSQRHLKIFHSTNIFDEKFAGYAPHRLFPLGYVSAANRP